MLRRATLFLLVAATALPFVVFSSVMVVLFSRQQQETIEQTLTQTARTAIDFVDREIASHLGALETLAASDYLVDHDLASFYGQAKRVMNLRSDWLNVAVTDARTRRQVIDLRRPMGAESTPPARPEAIEEVVRLRQPIIGGVQVPGEGGEPFVLFSVPVLRDGEVEYVISASVEAEVFSSILRSQDVPEGWIGAVLDDRYTIVGRSRFSERYVGTPATASLTEEIRKATRNFFFSLDKEGGLVYAAFSQSPYSGWTAAFGAPAERVERPLRYAREAILIGGGVALILAALLAVFLTVSLERRRKAEQRLVTVEALRETERRLADIAKNFPGIIYQRVLHPDGRVSFPYLSDRAMQLIGLDPDSVKDPMPLGTFSSRLVPEDRERWEEAVVESALTLSLFGLEMRTLDPTGKIRWVHTSAIPHREPDGRVVWDGVLLEITELKETEARLQTSLGEKETLLREVHHRVKNNLQVVSSMLNLEMQRVRDVADARERMEMIGQRIRVLSGIHDQLYGSDSFRRVNIGRHLEQIGQSLAQLHDKSSVVALKVDAERLFCDLETAIPLGLIANELITNSFKHAFPDGRAGTIRVSFRGSESADAVELAVSDDGVGIRPDGDAEGGTLGARLVEALVQQIDATLRYEAGGGTRVVVAMDPLRFAVADAV